MTNVVIDGVEYAPISPPGGEIRIVVLQRGWCMVGYLERMDGVCRLKKAKVIRRWGTTTGLGQIAVNGPTDKTVLDSAGTVEFDWLTVVASLTCEESKWAPLL